MKAVSRTIMATGLAVLATSAGIFLASNSIAQTNVPSSAPAGEAKQAHGKGPHAGHGGHEKGHKHDGKERGFMGMDVDKDGTISRAEFDAAGQKMAAMRGQMFDQADSNKDGKLSKDEMQAFRKSHRGERGPRGQHREGDMKGHQHGQPAAPAAPAPKQ